MDKVTINNQIVMMRKFVKQAKIHAINNYTKEIRKLQNRKGNDDETSKHKRKAERLISKIAVLRKIQPDTISRKALSKEKDWKDVLKAKDIPLEDQCYAMLANYGPVQSEVEKFHKKHWDLVPKIPTLFESWEEKSKNPMIKQEKKKAKELRKSLKAANVKLGKNNSNATPIGQINEDKISQTKPPLNDEEKCDVLNEASDDLKEELKSEDIQNKVTPMPIQDDVVKEEEDIDSGNEEIDESKNNLKKPLQQKCFKNKVELKKMDVDEATDKEESEGSLSKEIASDLEEKDLECESEQSALEEDSDSEDDESEEEKTIEESHESDIESETEEIPEDTEETKKESKVAMKPTPNSKTSKPLSIQAKLKAVADSNQKTKKYEKRKSSFKAKVDSAKKPEINNLKAVTMLNLNELEGLDEIPIEKNENITEETGEKKRKKDPFFLGKGGEVVSESDNEDSENLGQEKDGLEFKRRKFDNFDRKSSGEDFFTKRNFRGDAAQNRKPGFKENGFQRNNKNASFEHKSNTFQNREKSGFKENGFQRNDRNANFERKSNTFQKRERPSFEFHKDKEFNSMPKDQFRNKRETRSFGDRSSGKKQNFHPEPSNKERFQKNKLSSPLKKNPSDDKPLHPSWEAKKKLKESAKAKFQGKRIVFGD